MSLDRKHFTDDLARRRRGWRRDGRYVACVGDKHPLHKTEYKFILAIFFFLYFFSPPPLRTAVSSPCRRRVVTVSSPYRRHDYGRRVTSTYGHTLTITLNYYIYEKDLSLTSFILNNKIKCNIQIKSQFEWCLALVTLKIFFSFFYNKIVRFTYYKEHMTRWDKNEKWISFF